MACEARMMASAMGRDHLNGDEVRLRTYFSHVPRPAVLEQNLMHFELC